MRINEIIKEKRNAKGLTQEQVAMYLGVSTPAVNKWEKGTCYPVLHYYQL
ncbi:helix-turn-helix transcriptional regulator [Clostridium perfringens]|nr:helix-turn-helix transcriptional regulator [Clostridium perfringens]